MSQDRMKRNALVIILAYAALLNTGGTGKLWADTPATLTTTRPSITQTTLPKTTSVGAFTTAGEALDFETQRQHVTRAQFLPSRPSARTPSLPTLTTALQALVAGRPAVAETILTQTIAQSTSVLECLTLFQLLSDWGWLSFAERAAEKAIALDATVANAALANRPKLSPLPPADEQRFVALRVNPHALQEYKGNALKALVEAHPDWPPLQLFVAEQALWQGELTTARAWFEQVLQNEAAPMAYSTQAQAGLARTLYQQGHVRQALAGIQAARRALHTNPDVFIPSQYATHAREWGALAGIIQSAPPVYAAQKRKAPLPADAALTFAQALWDQGRYPEAQAMANAVKATSGTTRAGHRRVAMLCRSALAFNDTNRMRQTCPLVTPGMLPIAMQPSAWLSKARYGQASGTQQAVVLRAYQQALATASQLGWQHIHAETAVSQAQWWQAQGQLGQAKASMTNALAQAERFQGSAVGRLPLLVMAAELSSDTDADAAQGFITEALQLDPLQKRAYFLWGKLALAQNDLPRADSTIALASILDGGASPQIIGLQGDIALARNRAQDAALYWAESLALQPHQPQRYQQLNTLLDTHPEIDPSLRPQLAITLTPEEITLLGKLLPLAKTLGTEGAQLWKALDLQTLGYNAVSFASIQDRQTAQAMLQDYAARVNTLAAQSQRLPLLTHSKTIQPITQTYQHMVRDAVMFSQTLPNTYPILTSDDDLRRGLYYTTAKHGGALIGSCLTLAMDFQTLWQGLSPLQQEQLHVACGGCDPHSVIKTLFDWQANAHYAKIVDRFRHPVTYKKVPASEKKGADGSNSSDAGESSTANSSAVPIDRPTLPEIPKTVTRGTSTQSAETAPDESKDLDKPAAD